MDHQRFLERLPTLYEDWGKPSVRPRSAGYAEVLASMRAMTTANVLQLLNFALEFLEDGEVHCEVGCLQGATLIGALRGRPSCVAYAVDDFSEFNTDGQNHSALLRNLAVFGVDGQVRFHNQDFEEFLLDRRREGVRIGVYFYDGPHDYRSQLMGLLLAAPLLAERALIVVDDSNCVGVKQAAWDFMAARPECRLLLDLPTPGNGDPSFWNGLYVLGWDAGGDSGYRGDVLRRARQTALLEALNKLPR
jgi:hypothetical protein